MYVKENPMSWEAIFMTLNMWPISITQLIYLISGQGRGLGQRSLCAFQTEYAQRWKSY